MKVLLCCEDIHALLAFKQILKAAKVVDIECAVSEKEANLSIDGDFPAPLVLWVGSASGYRGQDTTLYCRLKPEVGKMPMVVGKEVAMSAEVTT